MSVGIHVWASEGRVKLIQRRFQNVRDHARKTELEEGNREKSGEPLREAKVTT